MPGVKAIPGTGIEAEREPRAEADVDRRGVAGRDPRRPGVITTGGGGPLQGLAGVGVLGEISVPHKRFLHIMREKNFLSPHRGRQRTTKEHDSYIMTDATNVV